MNIKNCTEAYTSNDGDIEIENGWELAINLHLSRLKTGNAEDRIGDFILQPILEKVCEGQSYGTTPNLNIAYLKCC